ncbi:MAG TPA: methionyl-tRNA formyltransferase [Candidatus Nanoarchaeia archaeon]|nr:methionyl-tRNA formyltransferase [Candidatus Nanoarchaeia archaeon]
MKKHDVRFAFFGTSIFSVMVLDELKKAGFTPALIVTTADKPQGRKLIISASPVKIWAQQEKIDVIQPDQLTPEVLSDLGNSEWDLFIVASYGKILPGALLHIPHFGSLNVHPSLLPKYRGASPIQSQILADDRKTGVTIMLMDEALDHGPIIAQARIEIDEADWPPKGSELEEMLATLGGSFLAETIPSWIDGALTKETQEEEKATFTKKITKEDGELDMNNGDARQNFLKIQAFDEWPVAYFFVEKKGKKIRVKITSASYRNGVLTLERVIPEGKKEMLYSDFLRS